MPMEGVYAQEGGYLEMRCASCGLPLSPSRTTCPRCGTPIAGKSEGRSSGQTKGSPDAAFLRQGSFNSDNVQVGAEAPQSRGSYAPSTPWPEQGVAFAQQRPPTMSLYQQSGYEAQEQLSFPGMNAPIAQPGDPALAMPPQEQQPGQPNYARSSANPITPINTIQQAASWPQASSFNTATPIQDAPQFPQAPQRSSNQIPSKKSIGGLRLSGRNGFTVAGLCVLTGGLLLVLVYMMAQGLPPSTSSNASSIGTVAAKSASLATKAPTPGTTDATATGLAVTPTPTFPGQQYIDNAQVASAVNTKTAQPTQLATNFKVSQQIFVTFAVHPGGRNGAVCLLWYLNTHQFTHYEFLASGNATPAYSYAYPGSAGTGYVEIYWASTTACSDKILAQHVDFTVGA